MAKAFNLTAELNLRGPANLKQMAASIRREIGSIDANVRVKIDRAAERSILGSSTALARLNKELQTTAATSATSTSNINALVGALNNLSGALSGSNNSMQRIVSTAEQTSRQMSRIRKNTAVARDEMEEFGRQSALAVRRFAAFNFATGVIYGFYNAVAKATSEFIEFDRQLVRLTQITGDSYNELSRITDTITGLSTNLGVASSDLIRISDTLAQAGLSARETDQALRALALTALAPSFDDLNNTVEGSIALMRQFKIGTEDLDSALGSINAVAAGFAVEASDIITAIQRTGGVFAAASKGVSEGTDALNEFIAVFTSVRATTRESAETIATGLRTIFTRIQREDTIEALREYGVNLLDVEGKFVGAYRAVQLLSDGLGKLDPRDVSFSRIVEELGGFRQIGKVLPLIQEFSTAQQALAVAQKGQGSLTSDAVKAQASLAVQFSKTRESFVALIRDIGQSDSFKTLINLGLMLANTFIKVADVAQPLLPILSILGAIKGAKALTSFVGGFIGGLKKVKPDDDTVDGVASRARTNSAAAAVTDTSRYLEANTAALGTLTSTINGLSSAINPLQTAIDNLGNSAISQLNNEIVALNNTISSIDFGGGAGPTLSGGGIVRKFATGGLVPGSGDKDTVPAMLTPGEFVMRKGAVKNIGADTLQSMNRYAGGAKVSAPPKRTGKLYDDVEPVLFAKSNKDRAGQIKVYDGDSIKLRIDPSPLLVDKGQKENFKKPDGSLLYPRDSGPGVPVPVTSRLIGFDAFEMRASKQERSSYPTKQGPAFAENRAKGREAKELALQMINNMEEGKLSKAVETTNQVDYYGRPMIDLKELGSALVEKGLAKESSPSNLIQIDTLSNRKAWLKQQYPKSDQSEWETLLIKDYQANYRLKPDGSPVLDNRDNFTPNKYRTKKTKQDKDFIDK